MKDNVKTIKIKELLLPDETYNQFVDDEIKKAGSVKWLENVLQKGKLTVIDRKMV